MAIRLSWMRSTYRPPPASGSVSPRGSAGGPPPGRRSGGRGPRGPSPGRRPPAPPGGSAGAPAGRSVALDRHLHQIEEEAQDDVSLSSGGRGLVGWLRLVVGEGQHGLGPPLDGAGEGTAQLVVGPQGEALRGATPPSASAAAGAGRRRSVPPAGPAPHQVRVPGLPLVPPRRCGPRPGADARWPPAARPRTSPAGPGPAPRPARCSPGILEQSRLQVVRAQGGDDVGAEPGLSDGRAARMASSASRSPGSAWVNELLQLVDQHQVDLVRRRALPGRRWRTPSGVPMTSAGSSSGGAGQAQDAPGRRPGPPGGAFPGRRTTLRGASLARQVVLLQGREQAGLGEGRLAAPAGPGDEQEASAPPRGPSGARTASTTASSRPANRPRSS